MWLEVKALFSVMSFIFMAIAMAIGFQIGVMIPLLLLISIGLVFMGDMMIGYQITHNELVPLIDPTPKGWELMELQMLDGSVHFINTRKGALGKRSFRMHKEDASVINDGSGGFRLINGNHGFRGHERYDRNIDPMKCKALEKMKGNTIQEIYRFLSGKKGDKI